MAGSGTEIKADARLGRAPSAGDGQRVVIICFSAPLHLKDEADTAPRPSATVAVAATAWREKRSGPARVANVTGNKNRPSGSRKLQSLQAASTDSETDNMYGRHGGIAGWKRSFVDYSWTIVPWMSSRRRTAIDISYRVRPVLPQTSNYQRVYRSLKS